MQTTLDTFEDDAAGADASAIPALEAPAPEPAAPAEEGPGPAGREPVGRWSVWREVLGTWWLGLALALSACGAAEFHFRWKVPGLGGPLDWRWVWPLVAMVLVSLLAGVLEGSHRAVDQRERTAEAHREEIERLFRTPQRRVVQAKYQLYRDALMCTQLVGFLMMTQMAASPMPAETALEIERKWGSEFLARFRGMFGTGKFGDVFASGIGGMFPAPRNQAITVYTGLADFLRLLAERITEDDLDPAYLHGRDEAPEPAGAATADARPGSDQSSQVAT